MRKANVVVALVLTGSAAWVGLARAEKPGELPVSPDQGSVKLDDAPELQHLREARKELNEAKDAFDKDPVDKANHRKEILKGIDDAIAAVDAEIDELKGK